MLKHLTVRMGVEGYDRRDSVIRSRARVPSGSHLDRSSISTLLTTRQLQNRTTRLGPGPVLDPMRAHQNICGAIGDGGRCSGVDEAERIGERGCEDAGGRRWCSTRRICVRCVVARA